MIAGAALACGGCDRFFGIDELPDGSATTTGDALDDGTANGDDAVDGNPMGCAGARSFVGNGSVIQMGTSYTTSINNAAWEIPTGIVVDGESVLVSTGTDAYHQPRLSPDGLELYLRHDRPPMAAQLAIMTRETLSGTFTVLTDTALTVTQTDVISTPTSAEPRHSLLAQSSNAVMYEVTNTAGTFSATPRRYADDDIEFRGGPQLAPDGLSMIFIGSAQGGVSVFRATRAALETDFETPVVLYHGTEIEETPFLSADCTRLYFSLGGMVYMLEST